MKDMSDAYLPFLGVSSCLLTLAVHISMVSSSIQLKMKNQLVF